MPADPHSPAVSRAPACLPLPSVHIRQRNGPRHAGSQLAPSQTSSQAHCQGSQPTNAATRSSPARRPFRSTLTARLPAPRGLSGSKAAAGRQAEGGGRGKPRGKGIPGRVTLTEGREGELARGSTEAPAWRVHVVYGPQD